MIQKVGYAPSFKADLQINSEFLLNRQKRSLKKIAKNVDTSIDKIVITTNNDVYTENGQMKFPMLASVSKGNKTKLYDLTSKSHFEDYFSPYNVLAAFLKDLKDGQISNSAVGKFNKLHLNYDV